LGFFNEFIKGIWRENPTFRIVLGICPTLAVSTEVSNGVGMGLAATFVLLGSNIIISLIRNVIPAKVRIPAFIVVISTFVTLVDLFMAAYTPALHERRTKDQSRPRQPTKRQQRLHSWCSLLVRKETLEPKEGKGHQACDDERDGKPLHARGNPAQRQSFSNPGHNQDGKGKAYTTPSPVYNGFEQGILFSNIKQADPQDRTVGGNEGQIDSQGLLKHRTYLLDDHLNELHQGGNNQDENYGLEKLYPIGNEQIALNKPGTGGVKRHNKDNGRTHAKRRLKFSGDPQKGAEPQKPGEHKIVNEDYTKENNKQPFH